MDSIQQAQIIAIIRGVASEDMIKTVQALLDGGIRFVEVTFNQAASLSETAGALSSICSRFGSAISLGAGTVMTPEQVHAAKDSGAEYIISPNVDTEIIRETKALGMLSIPGAFTPSEICLAYASGADAVKLFPAGSLGANYVKNLREPLGHIPLIAVGGIGLDNTADFFNAGVAAVGIGGRLVDKAAISQGRFEHITELARQYTGRVSQKR